MKAIFDQHIGIFEDAVPKEWCEKAIKTYEDNKSNAISRQKHEGVPSLYKKDTFLALELYNEDLCKSFNENFWNIYFKLYHDYYTLEGGVRTNELFINNFKIQKTLPTEGYHVWHQEHSPRSPFRAMAYTLYLNDVEEGGETEFLHQTKRINSKQGTLCIFPASYTHLHRGNPPLSGEKYIMTGWIEYYASIYHELLDNQNSTNE